MRTVKITRLSTGNDGTFGKFTCDTGFHGVTGELPWRFNIRNKSCILPSVYRCNYRWSEKHKRNVYHVDGVLGHDNIEMHSANLMGDIDLGFASQLRGCIALGESAEVFQAGVPPAVALEQMGVVNSRVTMDRFEAGMNHEDFELTIQWGAGLDPMDTKNGSL